MAKSPFYKGWTSSPWFSRRAGRNAGGSHPRYNNEGFLVDADNSPITDGDGYPIELPLDDLSTTAETLAFWNPSLNNGNDLASISEVFEWNEGFEYRVGENIQSSRIKLHFVVGASVIPAFGYKASFIARVTPSTTCNFTVRYIGAGGGVQIDEFINGVGSFAYVGRPVTLADPEGNGFSQTLSGNDYQFTIQHTYANTEILPVGRMGGVAVQPTGEMFSGVLDDRIEIRAASFQNPALLP
jgi:hypothetical protein